MREEMHPGTLEGGSLVPGFGVTRAVMNETCRRYLHRRCSKQLDSRDEYAEGDSVAARLCARQLSIEMNSIPSELIEKKNEMLVQEYWNRNKGQQSVVKIHLVGKIRSSVLIHAVSYINQENFKPFHIESIQQEIIVPSRSCTI